jgi:two-component system, chemotaxis family, chemotaxis protein CheY
MTPLNVLVVDDSLITVKKLTVMLQDLGHKVVETAMTGAEGLAAYRRLSPDLVTMDITMPDMDGIEATRRIIDEFPEARIVMVTSHGQEKMVLDALDSGAKGYVMKPVRPERLAEIIERVIARS